MNVKFTEIAGCDKLHGWDESDFKSANIIPGEKDTSVETSVKTDVPEEKLKELIEEFNKTKELLKTELKELDRPSSDTSIRVLNILANGVDLEKEKKKLELIKIISNLELLIIEVFNQEKIISCINLDIVPYNNGDSRDILFDNIRQIILILSNINDFIGEKFNNFSKNVEKNDKGDKEILNRAIVSETQMIKDIMENYTKKQCYENMEQYIDNIKLLTQQLEYKLQELTTDYQEKNNELNNNKQVLLGQFNDMLLKFEPIENLERIDHSKQNALNKSIKTIIEEIQRVFNAFQKEKNKLESRIELGNELVSIFSLNGKDLNNVLEKLDLFAKGFIQEGEKIDIEKVDFIFRNMTFIKLGTSETQSYEVKYLGKEGNKIPVTHDINSKECHLLPVEVIKSFVKDGRKYVMDFKKSDCGFHLCYELNNDGNWEQSDLLGFIGKDNNILVGDTSEKGQLIIDTKSFKTGFREVSGYLVSNNKWGYKKVNGKKYKCVNYKYIEDNFQMIYANFPK